MDAGTQGRDRISITVYTMCAVLFCLGVVFNLNGSSVYCWRLALGNADGTGAPLLGTPNWDRTDEWEVWTPWVIAQSTASPRFPAENPSLGPGKVAFLYNLPVRHYTMLFRPQHWGFFLFDVERGYAWYWNLKLFGLAAALFALFRLLTGQPLAALIGSLWVVLSSYVQWWFSCPPMLPEMLASWALACLGALVVFSTDRPGMRWLASGAILLGTANFALCMYPPFQVPLVFLGIVLVVAAGRRDPTRATAGWRALPWFLGALLLAVAVLIPLLMECRETLLALADTTYPGQRRSCGGGLNLHRLFSGMISFFVTPGDFPDGYACANESVNFYPLWIPALTAMVARKKWRLGPLGFGLVAYLLVLGLYMTVSLPRGLCRATLLDLTAAKRCLLPFGMAGILLSVVAIGQDLDRKSQGTRRSRITLAAVLSVMAVGYVALLVGRHPRFMTPWRTVTLCAVNAGIIVSFFLLPRRLFALTFIGVLACSNALVNPVNTGLSALLESTPRREILRLRKTDPRAAWVAYKGHLLSELIMSTGADAVSGVKIVPDLPFYQALDPDGTHRNLYNRYSFSYYALPPDPSAIRFFDAGPVTHVVEMHPAHPVFAARGVRFFASTFPLPDSAASGLECVSAMPQHGIWIYYRRPGNAE